MSHQQNQQLRVVLKFHCPSSESDSADGSFWTHILRCGGEKLKGVPIQISVLADHIRSFFPATIARFVSPALQMRNNANAASSDSGSFRALVTGITERENAKLEIGLQFQSPEKMAELFAYNYDFFDLFIRSYAPIAFLKAMQISPAHLIPWLGMVEQISSRIVAEPDFINYFNSSNRFVNQKADLYL